MGDNYQILILFGMVGVMAVAFLIMALVMDYREKIQIQRHKHA